MDSRSDVQNFIVKPAVHICLVLSLFVPSASCAAQQAQEQVTDSASEHEVHATYLLGGQPTGSYSETSRKMPGGEVQTVIESDLVFNRLGNKIKVKSTSHYEETADGQLKSAAADVSSSQQVTHIEASIVSHSLHITTTSGGRSYERTVELSGALLGPEAARRLVFSRRPGPSETITYDAFYPELGVVATITDAVVGTEEVSTDQGMIPALKIEQTMSAMPGKVTLWLDREGWLVRQTVPGPFGNVEALRSKAPVFPGEVKGAALPEETFSRSIIKANVRLPQERFVDSVRLKSPRGSPNLDGPIWRKKIST